MKRKDPWTSFGLYSGIGVQLVVTVGGGYFLGYYLDQKWHTQPWLGIVGFFVGSAVGFVYFYRLIRFFQKDDSQDE